VLVFHFAEGFIRVDKASAGEGFARLGVGPFAAEVFAPFLFKRLFQSRGVGSAAALLLPVSREALPQGSELSVQPPLQSVPGESDALGSVLLAGAGGSTQDALGQHLHFQPMLHIVVVSSSGQGASKTLSPEAAKLLGNVPQDWFVPGVHSFERGQMGLRAAGWGRTPSSRVDGSIRGASLLPPSRRCHASGARERATARAEAVVPAVENAKAETTIGKPVEGKKVGRDSP